MPSVILCNSCGELTKRAKLVFFLEIFRLSKHYFILFKFKEAEEGLILVGKGPRKGTKKYRKSRKKGMIVNHTLLYFIHSFLN